MSIPFPHDTGVNRRVQLVSPGDRLDPLKPADSISISLEFLRGVHAAAKAGADWDGPVLPQEIYTTVVAEEVDRLQEEVQK